MQVKMHILRIKIRQLFQLPHLVELTPSPITFMACYLLFGLSKSKMDRRLRLANKSKSQNWISNN